MATDVILPALGMSQDTGKIVRWLKAEGEYVAKGEPLVEIETDKATVEIEAPTDGVFAHVSAVAGSEVPVGQVIAVILSASEALSPIGYKEGPYVSQASSAVNGNESASVHPSALAAQMPSSSQVVPQSANAASALALRVAAEYNVDLSQVKASGKRIQKADVLAYLEKQESSGGLINGASTVNPRLVMASPKARRLAKEQGKDLVTIKGTGPDGAVLAADVLMQKDAIIQQDMMVQSSVVNQAPKAMADGGEDEGLSTVWRIMAERTTQSWTGTPHFYLTREVNASRFISWREHTIGARFAPALTYTDLLVKIVAGALRLHPRLNAAWSDGKITLHSEIHVGLAVAIEDGLVVPVIHGADRLGLGEIAQQRAELVKKAQEGKLRPQDISGGTFTISNLGMYKIDEFNSIINQPQAAILAVGRIAERVVPVNGQPGVQPMMTLTLSCDHRVVDGVRGARFLDSVANFTEEPLGLLT